VPRYLNFVEHGAEGRSGGSVRDPWMWITRGCSTGTGNLDHAVVRSTLMTRITPFTSGRRKRPDFCWSADDHARGWVSGAQGTCAVALVRSPEVDGVCPVETSRVASLPYWRRHEEAIAVASPACVGCRPAESPRGRAGWMSCVVPSAVVPRFVPVGLLGRPPASRNVNR